MRGFMGLTGGWAAGGILFTSRGYGDVGRAPMQLKPWSIMFAGAALCTVACAALIWMITATGDVSTEWAIWVLVLAGFGFLAGGYLSETRYKREHPEGTATGHGQ